MERTIKKRMIFSNKYSIYQAGIRFFDGHIDWEEYYTKYPDIKTYYKCFFLWENDKRPYYQLPNKNSQIINKLSDIPS